MVASIVTQETDSVADPHVVNSRIYINRASGCQDTLMSITILTVAARALTGIGAQGLVMTIE
jgi:hypothetical protein